MAETIISKKCYKCKNTKPLQDFYKQKRGKYGRKSICKSCHKILFQQTEKAKVAQRLSVKKFYLKHPEVKKYYGQSERGKAAQKRYSQSKKGKIARKHYKQSEKGKAAIKRYYQNRNRKKVKARNAVNNAISNGRLPRPDTLLCHYCPKPAQQYHHWHGYAPEHWLDVVPVCYICHGKYRLAS